MHEKHPAEEPEGGFPPEATKINPRTGMRESASADDLRRAIYDQKHPPKPGTIRRKAKPNGSTPPDAFPVTWVDEAQLDLDNKSLIKGLWDQGGFALIYGPSMSGKSFFTADIAQHIATAQPWRGRKTAFGLVVYIAAEAGRSIIKRFVGWRDQRMGEAAAQIPLAILTKGPNLLNMPQQEGLVEQLRALEVQAGVKLVLVVFDTLSRSIPGGDENESRDMTDAIGAADHLREVFGCATVFVHHSGKDPGRGARGHSALFAAADLVMLIDQGQATVEKCRDGVHGEIFPFTLEPVDLGVDADGDPIGTMLLHASDQPAHSGPRIVKLSGVAKLGLQAITEAIMEHGIVMPSTSTIPAGARAITIAQWRTQFKLRYGSDPEGGERESDAVRQAFKRAREQLANAEKISVSNPYCWLN